MQQGGRFFLVRWIGLIEIHVSSFLFGCSVLQVLDLKCFYSGTENLPTRFLSSLYRCRICLAVPTWSPMFYRVHKWKCPFCGHPMNGPLVHFWHPHPHKWAFVVVSTAGWFHAMFLQSKKNCPRHGWVPQWVTVSRNFPSFGHWSASHHWVLLFWDVWSRS